MYAMHILYSKKLTQTGETDSAFNNFYRVSVEGK